MIKDKFNMVDLYLKKIVMLTFYFYMALGLLVSANATTLREALELTFKNDKQLAVRIESMRSQLEVIAQAKALGGISFSGLFSTKKDWNFRNNTAADDITGSLVGSYSLYDNNLNKNKISLEEANLKILHADQKSFEQDILLGATSAFLDIIQDEKFVDLGKGNVAVLEKKFQEVNDRFELGEVTRTDVAQAESALASAKANLSSRRGILNLSRERYYTRVGAYPSKLKNITNVPKLPSNKMEAIKTAILKHPKILLGREKVERAKILLALAESSKGAKVKLKSTLSAGYNNDINDYSTARIAIEGTFPIFDGGKLNSAVRESENNLLAETIKLDAFRRSVTESVTIAWSNLKVARSIIEARIRQVNASEIAFNGVIVEEKLGTQTTFDVINAEQNLLEARTQLAVAERDEVAAMFEVLASVGRLNPMVLRLKLKPADIGEAPFEKLAVPLSPLQKAYDAIKKRYQ